METTQLRLELLDRIAVTEDAGLLKQLLHFLDMRDSIEPTMNEAEVSAYQAALQEGIADADSGNLVDFEAVKDYWQQRFAHGK